MVDDVVGGVNYSKLKEILRDEIRALSRSFIPELVDIRDGKLVSGAFKTFYCARITVYDASGRKLYRLHDIDLSKYWSEDRLTLPQLHNYLTVYSRVGIRYGYVAGYVKLPDLAGMGYDDWSTVWLGLELGMWERWGIASWVFRKLDGKNRLFAHAGGCGFFLKAEQTVSLPGDYTTARHMYWVKLNKHQVWFGIDNRIRVFVLKAPSAELLQLYENQRPYTIIVANLHIPEIMHALVELSGTKEGQHVGMEVELGYPYVRWAEGDPQPPLALSLYVEAGGIVVGYSVKSGSLTTHPVPVYGYEGKTLYFMADKDGTVSIEVLTLAGNWREYDSVSLSANKLLAYTMAGEALLARIVYTPASYPAKVLEGFAVMR